MSVPQSADSLPPATALDGLMAIYGNLVRPGDTELTGETLGGRYRLMEKLGEGGMGEVFRAEQTEPVQREVAVKVMKGGTDSGPFVARFEAERQTLALMEHHGIARVYDGGVTLSGRPFLVMELVRDGLPLTEYCTLHLPQWPERLALFGEVCAAVQHAHQKGVIHRDLKPSNILVSAEEGGPRVRVIDFGVARAADEAGRGVTLGTRAGFLLGTPCYMSPEQMNGETAALDTRSDVYSLGAVLYELLTGHPPFDAERLRTASIGELCRIIRDEEPPPPSERLRSDGDSRRATSARRELDWIVMQALAKDPSRRYRSAAALADDVQRFLRSDVVFARPASRGYRLRKWAARHKTVTAAAAAAVIALTGTAALSLWQARREARERATAEAILRFFHDDILSATRRAAGVPAAGTGDPLGSVARRLEEDFAGQPVIAARIRTTLGRAYLRLGDTARAEQELPPAFETLRRHFGEDHAETLRAAAGMAELALARGDAASAVSRWRDILQRLPDNGDSVAQTEAGEGLARALSAGGQDAEAREWFEKTLSRHRTAHGMGHSGTLQTVLAFASHSMTRKERGSAESLLRDVITARTAPGRTDDADTLAAVRLLATVREHQGDAAGALTLRRRTLEGLRSILGSGHPDTLRAQQELAVASERLDDVDTALALATAAASTYHALGQDAAAVDAFVMAARLAETRAQFENVDRYRSMAFRAGQRLGLPATGAHLPRSVVRRRETDGHQYQRIEVPMAWTEARALCEALGGHLATIESKEENEFLYTYFSATTVCWLGASIEAGQWRWVTGEPFIYQNWAGGEPSDATGEVERYLNFGNSSMTFLRKGPQWNDHRDAGDHAGWHLTYPLCEWDPPAAPPPPPAISARTEPWPATARHRWEGNGHWYARINVPASWSESVEICTRLGGHLATAADAAENEWLNQTFGSFHLCWLGATNAGGDGQWRWITGEPWQWQNWAVGEPSFSEGIEHWLQFGTSPFSGIRPFGAFWNDSADTGDWYSRPICYPLCEWETEPAE